jgi:DNA-binding response OmpR family regulator
VSRPLGARVLVVDDEPAILRVVQANLARHGFHARTTPADDDAPGPA